MTTIDELGRRAARAALDEAQRTTDVDAGLHQIRTGVTSAVAATSQRPRRWLVVASVAAAAASVAGITVIALHEDDPARIVPVVETPTTTEAPASTIASQTTVTQSTVTQTTVTQTTAVPTTSPPIVTDGAVSYLDPPPMFEPEPFATVPISRDATIESSVAPPMPEMAVLENSVAVVDRHGAAILIVDRDTDAIRSVPVQAVPVLPVGGPGDVLYGIDSTNEDPEGYRFIATALDGVRAGEVVASEPIPILSYLEIGYGTFGHGPTGIVDRARNVGAQVMPYVDSTGRPTTLTEPASFFTMSNELIIGNEPGTVTGTDPALTWALQIERHPDAAGLYVGEAPPASTEGGAAVVWTWIGPAEPVPDTDFPPPTMQVVAWLDLDGSVTWRQLPDGWQVVSSDLWGTLLAHQIGDQVELAWLTPPAGASAENDLILQTMYIGAGCVPGSCPTLAFDDNGLFVSYDAVARTLTIHEPISKPRTIDLSGIGELAPTFSWLEHVGPGDVAYVSTQRAGESDPIGDLLAIPLSGPSMGTVVQRVEGIDFTGDSDLVPTSRGLVVVGCCDFAPRRPAADAELVIAWVDENGEPYPVDSGSELWLEFRDDGTLNVNLTRVDGPDSTWTIDGVNGFRGMPLLTGTSDGGAIISLHDTFDSQSKSRIVVMHPDGSMDEHSIAPYVPTLLGPNGEVIVFDEGVGYAQVLLDH